jgi:hypothetical protein
MMLQVEEYRGFDGEILFLEQEKECEGIMRVRGKVPPKGECYGIYPRLLFMQFIDGIAKKKELHIE